MGGMRRSPDERPPAVIDFVMSQSIFAGFMIVLIGALAAVLLPLLCLASLPFLERPLPFDWYWPIAVGFAFGVVFILAGGMLVLVGALIAKWWWGEPLREFFFGSPGQKSGESTTNT
jgi:hypothetical protein